MASIKEKALLVSLSVSFWTNTAADAGVVNDIMAKTHTGMDVHRYKKVLVKPEAMTPVKSARAAMRKHWWDNTLPWGNGGVRLLPSERYQKFAEQMRTLRNDYETAVAGFVSNYPKMKAEARKRLGPLFREEDFPSLDGIKGKFQVSLDFAPIPDAKDFRIDLSEAERKEIHREVERMVAENTRTAMGSLVERMAEVVKTLTERLKEADPTIRQSLFDNLVEVCKEVEEFNLLGDSQITALRKGVETLAAKPEQVDHLKEDKKARAALAKKADDILAKMASYIGDKQ